MCQTPFMESVLRAPLQDMWIRQNTEQVDCKGWNRSREWPLQRLRLGADQQLWADILNANSKVSVPCKQYPVRLILHGFNQFPTRKDV